MSGRAVLGILLGFALWWALFVASVFLVVAVWPESEALRAPVEAGDYSVVPATMLILFLGVYIVIGLASGWATVAITRREAHVWIVATPILLYATFQHLFVLWNNLPNWYNVAVLLFIWPFIVVGGRLAGERPVALAASQSGGTRPSE